jgi:polyferredoxin
MKALQQVLRDKNSNNLIVAIIVGFGAVTFIQGLVNWWNASSGQTSYWTGQIYRTIIAFVITIGVAELVARQSR